MEGIPVQTFHQNPESGTVPLEDLDQCASAIAECEHTAGVRVEMEFQLINVRLRLQNANIQREYGSRWNFSLMIAAKPV